MLGSRSPNHDHKGPQRLKRLLADLLKELEAFSSMMKEGGATIMANPEEKVEEKGIKDENVAQFVDDQLINKEHTLLRKTSSTTSRTRVSWRTTTTSATVPVSLTGSTVRPWAL